MRRILALPLLVAFGLGAASCKKPDDLRPDLLPPPPPVDSAGPPIIPAVSLTPSPVSSPPRPANQNPRVVSASEALDMLEVLGADRESMLRTERTERLVESVRGARSSSAAPSPQDWMIGSSESFDTTANPLAACADANVAACATPIDTVRVLFGTNRARDGDNPYGARDGEHLAVGSVLVSIPVERHRVGRVEQPSRWKVWRVDFGENKKRHVVIEDVDEFGVAELRGVLTTELSGKERKDVFVFVHGFNVAFPSAARRAAQIAHDMRWSGVTAMYSWPSLAALSRNAYQADEATAERSVPHFRAFIDSIAVVAGGSRVYVVAHSMGTRVVSAALRDLVRDKPHHQLNQLVLAAPDIDAGVFAAQIAPALGSIASRTTVYASIKDRALKQSRDWHNAPRAGQDVAHIAKTPGFDAIDASSLDTDFVSHSYYGSSRTLLNDLIGIVLHGRTPPERNLTPMLIPVGTAWRFPP